MHTMAMVLRCFFIGFAFFLSGFALAGAGNAFKGNDRDARIVVPHDTRFNSPELTVEAWVKLDTWPSGDDRMLVGKYRFPDATHFSLGFDWLSSFQGRFGFYFGSGGKFSQSLCTYGPASVAVNQWYHLAGVHTSTETILYQDGIEVMRISAIVSLIGNSLPVVLGEYNNLYIPGQLDEVRIWNYARSAEEIRCGMKVAMRSDEPGLLLLLHLDEAAGARFAMDSSAFSTDGQVQGEGTFINSEAPLSDDMTCYDYDGDGYSTSDGDCDDSDDAISPAAFEKCDGVDNNCNGVVDEQVEIIYYVDADGDGWGGDILVAACAQPEGASDQDGDCEDGDAAVNPGAVEVCDGLDNDCDGVIDEQGLAVFYPDVDGDGFGTGTPQMACQAPPGYSTWNGDCDDTQLTVYPGAPEQCDGLDNDCDGNADESLDWVEYYLDGDQDGYGDADLSVKTCEGVPEGYASSGDDCNDQDAGVYPGAPELCNKADDDCDGTADEDPVDGLWIFPDVDGDGYGAVVSPALTCEVAAGETLVGGDCDDHDPSVYPGAEEQLDGKDNDCDNSVDEDGPFATPEVGDDDTASGDDDTETGDDDASPQGDDDDSGEEVTPSIEATPPLDDISSIDYFGEVGGTNDEAGGCRCNLYSPPLAADGDVFTLVGALLAFGLRWLRAAGDQARGRPPIIGGGKR